MIQRRSSDLSVSQRPSVRRSAWKTAVVLWPIALGSVFGCGGLDVSGDWSGEWLCRTGVGGSSDMSLSQSGQQLSGQTQFTGSPCFAGAIVAGEIRNDEIDASLRAGGIRIDLQATATDNELNGTYHAVSAGACTGDTGTFTMKRR